MANIFYLRILDLLNPLATRIVRHRRAARARSWARQENVDGLVSVRIDGAQILVPQESSLGPPLFANSYERSERAFLLRFLRPGNCFWDVGANIGLYSAIAARAVGPSGAVLAIEPSPAVSVLAANLSQGCADFRIVRAAAGRASGSAFLQASSDSDPYAHLAFGDEALASASRVQVVPLDQLLDSFRIPDLVKIDSEGSEFDVLLGASNLLRARPSPTLMVEFNESMSAARATSCESIRNLLEETGYTILRFRLRSLGGPLLQALPRMPRYPEMNVIATTCPAELAVRIGVALSGPETA